MDIDVVVFTPSAPIWHIQGHTLHLYIMGDSKVPWFGPIPPIGCQGTQKATGGMPTQHDNGDGWHDDGDGRHDDGKGQQGERRHDDDDGRHHDGDGQHDNGKGQQGDGWHNNAARWRRQAA
jgi:hypothetical protein